MIFAFFFFFFVNVECISSFNSVAMNDKPLTLPDFEIFTDLTECSKLSNVTWEKWVSNWQTRAEIIDISLFEKLSQWSDLECENLQSNSIARLGFLLQGVHPQYRTAKSTGYIWVLPKN